MASNPMQRKARISFLMGVLVTLLITGLIIGFLLVTLAKQAKEQKEIEGRKKSVYVLKTDIKSGQPITDDDIEVRQIDSEIIPAQAITGNNLEQFKLQDKQGRSIKKSTTDGKTFTYKMDVDGQEVEVNIDEATGSYYYILNNQRQEVELVEVPFIAKVDLEANTVLCNSLVGDGVNSTADDVREQEYNMLTLPAELETGDYIDVRLMLPDGTDFVVVSKKSVTIPEAGGVPIANTIKMNLRENEILYMGSAIVDSFLTSGSKLYVTKYTDAGLQKEASSTYIPSGETLDLLRRDANILESIKRTIVSGGSQGAIDATALRDRINRARNSEIETLQEKVTTSIENSQAARQEYLNGIAGE